MYVICDQHLEKLATAPSVTSFNPSLVYWFACLLLQGLVGDLPSSLSSLISKYNNTWPYCFMPLGWVRGSRCFVWYCSRSAGACCVGFVLLLCHALSFTSSLLSWDMHSPSGQLSQHYLHIGLFVMWSIFGLVTRSFRCLIVCCYYKCFCFYLESCFVIEITHQSTGNHNINVHFFGAQGSLQWFLVRVVNSQLSPNKLSCVFWN